MINNKVKALLCACSFVTLVSCFNSQAMFSRIFPRTTAFCTGVKKVVFSKPSMFIAGFAAYPVLRRNLFVKSEERVKLQEERKAIRAQDKDIFARTQRVFGTGVATLRNVVDNSRNIYKGINIHNFMN